MKLFLDCYPCLLQQALSTAELLGLDEAGGKRLMDQCMRIMLSSPPGTSPQRVVVELYDYIREVFTRGSSTLDPYGRIKEETNRAALRHVDRLEEMVSGSDRPLETAVSIAAAGNIIDFGAKKHGSIDIGAEIENIPSLRFAVYDVEPLVEKLGKGGLLLYIGDNAGEIVFDRVFIQCITREFPGTRVIFAVRERPIINDATLEDARRVGMDRVAGVISSGSIYPGTVLEETSDRFRGLFEGADLVISKGQGNYECLQGVDKEELYYILRVKCTRVSRYIGADIGELVLLRNGAR